MSDSLIALGANLPEPEGDPASNLRRALQEMAGQGLMIRAVSRFFATPCFPPGAGPDYVNAAALVQSDLSADAVLQRLHAVENRMKRTRAIRWGMRTMDLDLIAHDDQVLPDTATQARWRELPPEAQKAEAPGELILPHPRLAERAFVLVPLADIMPDWVHPVTRQTVMQMLDNLAPSARAEVVPI